MTVEQRNAVQAVLQAVSDAVNAGLTKKHIILTAAMKRNRPCTLRLRLSSQQTHPSLTILLQYPRSEPTFGANVPMENDEHTCRG
jgi:hypothetical protein